MYGIPDRSQQLKQPVFGPQSPSPANPLGKDIRIRVDLEGCRGLPCGETSIDDPSIRHTYHVRFEYISSRYSYVTIRSSATYEGERALQGTLQWNELLYLDCAELSYIRIILCRDDAVDFVLCNAGMSLAQFLVTREFSLWPQNNPYMETACILFLSTSRVSIDGEEQVAETSDGSLDIAQHNDLNFGLAIDAGSWAIAFRRLLLLMEIVHQRLEIRTTVGFLIVWNIYRAYRVSVCQQLHDANIDKLLIAMLRTADTISQVPYTRMGHRRECLLDIMYHLFLVASEMYDLSRSRQWHSDGIYEAELARLTLNVATLDSSHGVSTSAGSLRSTIVSTIAKDALLLALKAIADSADAFPPLKSAASGLLFFTTCADMAIDNRKQIHDIRKRVDGLARSLRGGANKGSLLTSEHRDAIKALAEEIAALNEDMEDILSQRKNRFMRFFSAKRHRDELQGIVTQLEIARVNYMIAISTFNATTIANVCAHVRAHTLILGATPVLAPGTRRAEDVSLPSVSHIEEM